MHIYIGHEISRGIEKICWISRIDEEKLLLSFSVYFWPWNFQGV